MGGKVLLPLDLALSSRRNVPLVREREREGDSWELFSTDFGPKNVAGLRVGLFKGGSLRICSWRDRFLGRKLSPV